MRFGFGYWGVAVGLIALASSLFYLFTAPRGWREWSRAALIQAFLIDVYAETYGFPLTLYVLRDVFGVAIPWVHTSGHLWTTLLGLGV